MPILKRLRKCCSAPSALPPAPAGTCSGAGAGMASGAGVNRRQQAHQRQPHIGRWRRLRAWHDEVDIGWRAQQTHDFRLHMQHDAPTQSSQSRQIAQRQNRIAEALLGMQQQRAAIKRGAVPQRLRRHDDAFHFAQPPAPIVVGPGFGITTEREIAQAAIPMGVDMVGIDFDRPVEGAHRFFGLARFAQGHAVIVPVEGAVPVEIDGARMSDQRFIKALQVFQRIAEIGPAAGLHRLERHRAAMAGDGKGGFFLHPPQHAEIDPRAGMVRRHQNQAAIDRQRFVVLALLVQRGAAREKFLQRAARCRAGLAV